MMRAKIYGRLIDDGDKDKKSKIHKNVCQKTKS